MARRPAPKDNSEALLGLPARGRHERAMEATIRGWRAAGKVIDPSMSMSLRSQAAAVDLAIAKGDYWHIGNANRVLAELRAQFVDRVPVPDSFDAFMAAMTDDRDFPNEALKG